MVNRDCQKAFDTIIKDHVLTRKLHYNYKVRNTSRTWLGSYLKKHKPQIVRLSISSNLNKVEIGVPQGYYWAYSFHHVCDYLFRVIDDNQCKMVMYADGTVLCTYTDDLICLDIIAYREIFLLW